MLAQSTFEHMHMHTYTCTQHAFVGTSTCTQWLVRLSIYLSLVCLVQVLVSRKCGLASEFVCRFSLMLFMQVWLQVFLDVAIACIPRHSGSTLSQVCLWCRAPPSASAPSLLPALEMAPKLAKSAGKVVVKGPTKGTKAAEKAIKKEEEELVLTETATSAAMGKQPAQKCMDILKSLSKGGRDYPIKAYKALKSHEEKRNFAKKLFLDRQASFLEAEEAHFTKDEEVGQELKGWMYPWDICRVNGVQWNEEGGMCAKWLGAVTKSLESRPAPDADLQEAGYKQYYYEKKLEDTKITSSGKQISAKATAKVKDEEEFNEIVASISGKTQNSVDIGKGKYKSKKDGKEPKELTAKQAFDKWTGIAVRQLQGEIAKAGATWEKMNVSKSIAINKQFTKQVQSYQVKLEKGLAKLIKEKALASGLSEGSFGTTKFSSLKKDVDALLDEASSPKNIVKEAIKVLGS